MEIWTVHNGLPQVDWEHVDDREAVTEEWFERLRRALGAAYLHLTSRNLRLLAPADERRARGILRLGEETLGLLVRFLPELVAGGRIGVLYFDSRDRYYDFIDVFHSDGEWIASAGIFLAPASAIAINHSESFAQDYTLVHELGHAALRECDLPLWTEEGLVRKLQGAVHGAVWPPPTPDRIREHRDYWKERGLAGFWDGSSWGHAEAHPEFHYELAWMLLRGMELEDRAAFRAFLVDARAADAGEASCRAHFGCGLADRAATILGP